MQSYNHVTLTNINIILQYIILNKFLCFFYKERKVYGIFFLGGCKIRIIFCCGHLFEYKSLEIDKNK